ncbi:MULTISPECIES: hypothetical protein [Sphingomonadales]|uniref:Uncharacterized protein n=1 Tax=Edaphosphingomonas haloaromaticamans TaxID=653954 RepID=A0A1S1HLG1_9SPHN|nr:MULTISPECIES: hypothetical protein [Sphingomonas]OHT22236.1 hypothetical protein BHE75_04261 [Sphingomonas haloaromaticamans]
MRGVADEEEARRALRVARAMMADALERLDVYSRSPAAATLDLAIHHLDRELGGPVPAAAGG